MKNIFIHTGYIKTGTTWLQNLVFNNHDDINYLGKTEDNYPEWLINWHYFDDCFFDQNHNQITEIINSQIIENKINLISSEAFTLPGGQLFNQAKRIKQVVDNPKIILTLRNPLDLIYSYYKDDMNNGDYLFEFEYCLDWKRTPHVFYKRKPIYLPDFFFNESIDIYKNLFGENNLCVLKFEDMISNPELFFIQLGVFMGLNFNIETIRENLKNKLNKSPEVGDIPSRRAENMLLFLQQHFPGSEKRIATSDLLPEHQSVKISPDMRARLEDYFKGKCYDYF